MAASNQITIRPRSGKGTSPSRYSMASTLFNPQTGNTLSNPITPTVPAATATSVSVVNVTNKGTTAYAGGATATWSGGGGSSLSMTVNLDGSNFLSSITINSSSSDFTSAPLITIVPTSGGAGATATANLTTFGYMFIRTYWVSPDYPSSDPQFFFGPFASPTSLIYVPEIPATNTFYLEGLSLMVGGVRILCDNPATPGTPATSALSLAISPGALGDTDQFGTGDFLGFGILSPKVTVNLPPATLCEMIVALKIPIGTKMPYETPFQHMSAGNYSEQQSLSTASQFASLSSGTYGAGSFGQGAFLRPSYAICKGGDGRPSVLLLGASGDVAGANDYDYPAGLNANFAYGHITRGLDDNTMGKRIPLANFAISGSQPVSLLQTSYGHNWPVNWRRKINSILAAKVVHGQLPFDYIIVGGWPNSLSAFPSFNQLRDAMGGGDSISNAPGYYALLKTLFNVPLIATESQSIVGASSDFWTSVANQTPGGPWVYDPASGAIPTSSGGWRFRQLISNLHEPPDGASWFRTAPNDYLTDSFAPWRGNVIGTLSSPPVSGEHPATLRGYFSTPGTPSFQTTTTAVCGSNSVTMAAAPPLGSCLVFGSAPGTNPVIVNSVVGLTVGWTTLGTPPTGLASATTVTQIPGDGGALHPSPIEHADATRLLGPVLAFKKRFGWA